MDNIQKASSPRLENEDIQNQEHEKSVQSVLQRLVDEKFSKEIELRLKKITGLKSQKKIEKQVLETAKKRLDELTQKDDFNKRFDSQVNLEIQKRIQQVNQEKFLEAEIEKRKQESQKYYIQQQQALIGVVNRTREVPLNQTPPKDQNKLYKVEFPESGGIHSKIENFILPYRGFPYQETVQDLDKCKKIGKTFALVMLEELKKINPLKALLIILFLPSMTRAWLKGFHAIMKEQRFKENMYCQPVKELWRVLNDRMEKTILVRDFKTNEMIRDLSCEGLEYDNAYKYRWQDAMVLFNKDNLRKNPLKELNRVIDIVISRELPKDMETGPKIHWRKIKKVFNIIFRIKRSYLYWLRDLILELNFDEIKMRPEDICFCEKRIDYEFGYKDKPEYKEWLEIKRKAEKKPKKRNKIIKIEPMPKELQITIDTPKWSFIKYKDNGKMDYPSPIPFTVNYGRAIGIKSDEGDDADVVVLGKSIKKGTNQVLPLKGVINFIDRGINDPKYICSFNPVSITDKINITIFFTLFAIFKNVLNILRGKKGITKFKGFEIY